MSCLCHTLLQSWLLVVGPGAAMSVSKEGEAQLHSCKRGSWKKQIERENEKKYQKTHPTCA